MSGAEDVVWVSRAMQDSTLIKGFTNDLLLADEDRAIDAMRRNEAGEPLPPDRFPQVFYARAGSKLRRLPPLANAGGFWVASAELAEVLRRFDLGRSALYPTRILRHDRKTPLEGEYFCLNFGERKSAFLPEHSPRARSNSYEKVKTHWYLQPVPEDGDLAVALGALSGSDIWIDSHVRYGFFVSDRLAQALKAAKLAGRLGLFRCRVIGDGA